MNISYQRNRNMIILTDEIQLQIITMLGVSHSLHQIHLIYSRTSSMAMIRLVKRSMILCLLLFTCIIITTASLIEILSLPKLLILLIHQEVQGKFKIESMIWGFFLIMFVWTGHVEPISPPLHQLIMDPKV